MLFFTFVVKQNNNDSESFVFVRRIFAFFIESATRRGRGSDRVSIITCSGSPAHSALPAVSSVANFAALVSWRAL